MAFDPPLLEEDLQAYVDGELSGKRRETIARQLLNSPEDARKVAAWREQNRIIRAAFSGVASETIPQSLNFDPPGGLCNRPPLRFVHKQCASIKLASSSTLVLRAVVICAAFVLGLLTAFCAQLTHKQLAFKFSPPPANLGDAGQDFADRTIAALKGFTQTAEAGPAKIVKEVNSAFILPSLAPEGFALAGLRIFPNAESNMACLFYSKPKLSPLTLCVEPAPETNFNTRTLGLFPKAVVVWQQMGAAYGLSGPLTELDLRHLAAAVVSEIESFGPPPKLSPGR